MRYEAKIENNIVVDTIVCEDDYVNNFEGNWIIYEDYNSVSVGYTYSETEGFRPQKPYDSWIWNEDVKMWTAPVPVPDNDNIYDWNEETKSWVLTYIKV